MTAVQKIIEQIDEEVQVLSNLYGSEIKGRLIALAFAKKRCLEMLEMEKQQIIDAYQAGDGDAYNLEQTEIFAKQYYNETYGSKVSDETKTNNMKIGTSSLMDSHLVDFSNKNAHLIKSNTTTSSQTEISDSTITDQIDGIIFQLPFDDKIKLWELIEKLVEENRTEISDEEIERWAEDAWSDYEYEEGNLYSTTFKGGWKLAIKWYREQLKQR